MELICNLKSRILSGGTEVCRKEALELIEAPLEELTSAARELQQKLCGASFHLCTIINGKSGRCSEDCAYCAQSCRFHTGADIYGVLPSEEMAKSALNNYQQGIRRFSIVTSGRALTDQEIDEVCEGFSAIRKACPIGLCSSNGLLTLPQLKKLKAAGVTRYHCNLETSRRFFPSICSTHTYDEKLQTLHWAKEAGLQLCSGGILGMGETMEDRIDMALTLRELGVDSVPMNVLNPIPGTPLENCPALPYDEIRRTAAIFRFLLPKKQIRMAGGRALFPDKGLALMESGLNAAISGDMLTTYGISPKDDFSLAEKAGYHTILS